ncbi:MAG: adenylate/guanylate cyclase domain-containing protein, partial [Kiloniellales bacterium]|nr:adenylate/guanylate cyclase domain-containing protein [Kiloniellales bacterium]
MERRLAAVLAADMVGYSRLMAKDEAGTIARQKRHRADLIDPKIAQYGGRIVKTTGDGLLVEFASVVDAVQCSLEIQAAMPKREADQSEDRRIRYRIGINLGDIVLDGEDILGDGVNVAARLEGLADPGGVMISDGVYQNIQGKLQVSFQDLGLLSLKNMERKVRAWKWVDAAVSDKNSLHSGPPLTQPEKPSLAVLPFDNLSNDPDQEFLADGIAEDVITELSKFKSLFVIARCSSFAFKGQALDAKEISHKLGVRYVVEGSVRRSGNRVRITAQLIDANEDKHIWAERYDRDLEDIFSLQDEVTVAVVSAIEPQLSFSERKRALRKPP